MSTIAAAQSTLPPALRDVGIDQRLNQQAPLELIFRDETGRAVRLSEYFGSKPIIVAPVYFDCPMLCTQVLNGLVGALRVLRLEPGRDFRVLAVSFDPREGPALAAAKKEQYLTRYTRPGAAGNVHLLTGEQAAIEKLTGALGFRYAWDATSGQFAHAAAIMVLTPEGRIARYLYGIEYSPRDLRLALVEAAAGKIGSPVDRVLLYCFHYDPATGKYSLVVMNVIRALGAATVLGLGSFVVVMFRRDRRQSRRGDVRFPAVS